ncbi:MAG: hypothetical protein O7A98_02355 [Acidobacteria bacterium]|nr:hypothetical protein [Acidobacteriota bacterium]
MKRVQREDIEREIQELEEILEVAAGEYSEEDHARLCAMVRAVGEVKRELVKKRPSMKRVKQLVRGFSRSEFVQITADLRARTAKSR